MHYKTRAMRFGAAIMPALFGLLLLGGPVYAQQVFGSIFGTVTDPSGSAVANARVTVTDVNKGTTFQVSTNEAGAYSKGQLIPDTYTVEIEAKGFQRVKSDEIRVHVDEAARYDVTLKVGDVATEVEVTAAAPLLQSDRSDVAQTFSAHEVNNLPNLGRNLQSMELLNPGTAKIGWQHASDENPQGSIQMVVNGQLFDSMGYELDGTTNQDPILGIIVINPTFDSVNELKQANQNFDAEFSYVGGGIAGPIKKDKLFYFADVQLNRQSQGGSLVTSVPTAQNRAGNFSDWAAYNPNFVIYDPPTGSPQTGVGRTPYPGNTIPASQISPQAKAIASYFPLPNYQQIANAPFVNNYAK